GKHIGDVDAAIIRPALFALIGHMRQVVARGSMNYRGVGGQLRRRAGLPIAGNRAINQLGPDLFERGVIEPEAAHHAATESLAEHIGGGADRVPPLETGAAVWAL